LNRFAAIAIAVAGAIAGAIAMYLLAPSGGGSSNGEAQGAAVAGSSDAALHLDAASAKRAGIEVAPLVAAEQQALSSGYARALDLSPLAAIASEIVAARTAADASGRELQRLERLAGADQAASQREVDAARAQAAADQSKWKLACQRVTLEYGAGLGRLGCAAIPALVRDVASGNAVLLRIDMPDAEPPAGSAVEVGSGGIAARVRVLGPAAIGDPQLQTAGVLALLRGRASAAAQIGRVLPAHLRTGALRQGVLVPREAMVRADGGLFLYRTAGKDGYERIPLEGGEATDSGWFVPVGALKPGDHVVTAGAGTLLGLEHSAPSGSD
jgi:hypothetical protein